MPKERRNNKSNWKVKVVDVPYSLANYLKRKARDLLSLQVDEEYSAALPCDNTVDSEGDDEIKLPSEIWGMVLDYLPYGSVVSFASTSHASLHHLLPFVSSLHIEKSAHLRLGLVSKQLRDVRNVSIYNLFHPSVGDDDNIGLEEVELDLDEDMVIQLVPFFSRFTHLEKVYFRRNGGHLYSFTSLGALSMHQLIDSISGHFDCRSLSHNLSIYGLSCPKGTSRGDCKICKRVCKKFPLEHIFDIGVCLPVASIKETIQSRREEKDYLLSDTWFLQLLGKTVVAGISAWSG